MLRTPALVVSLFACNGEKDDGDVPVPITPCEAPIPPAEATLRAGMEPEGRILPGGRLITPVGIHAALGGFPADVLAHPTAGVAYVASTGTDDRALQVVDLADGAVLQQLPRSTGFVGFALDGDVLYAAGGGAHTVERWDVAADGLLTDAGTWDTGGFTAGMALLGDRLWVAHFVEHEVVAVDVRTGAISAVVPLDATPFSVAAVGGEIWVTLLGGTEVVIVDPDAGTVTARIEVGKGPEGIAVSPDGATVWVAVTDADLVVQIDAASRAIASSMPVGDLLAADGTPLPGSSPVDVALFGDTLFVARAADNAVSMLDAASLAPLGAFSTGWYPTALSVTADGRVVVSNGKGSGTGPFLDGSGTDEMTGTISIVAPSTLDLAASTAQVNANLRRPAEVYPFACDGSFPIPTTVGGPTPIEHVVLLVRENKTYDAVLGDFEGGDGDPTLTIYGREITPNLHALVERFASHDNFYNNSEVSAQGHLWLTAAHVTDYLERTWLEEGHGGASFTLLPGTPVSQPTFGTIFTRLIEEGIPFTNYGEGVGLAGVVGEETVLSHTDLAYPGALFNLEVPDVDRANYLIEDLLSEGAYFPPFVFAILPRDHTYGTTPGRPTPESMVADNDVATGMFIEALSHSPYWENTVVFIVEDDPQDGFDHVDYHRSILVVASPWAKAGHVSHVNTDFPSLLGTIERILGVEPLNRADGQAALLWDAFTSVPDTRPYDLLPSTVPIGTNARTAPGAALCEQMDFRGPDRNPDLPAVLWWARKGAPPPGSRVARIAAGEDLPLRHRDDDDDD